MAHELPAEGRAIQLAVADATVTVWSPEPAVADWITRYVAPWWRVTPSGCAAGGPEVTVTTGGFAELAAEVSAAGFREVAYPRAATRYALGRQNTVIAVTPTDRVGYRYTPGSGRMDVHAEEPHALPRAAARVARELVRAQLVATGWTLLHASAVVWPGDGEAVLVLGGRGAGKSTTAFTLASRGAGLLGNDRVFARAAPGSGVELAPWPSGAAVGLGLLGALGWAQVVRERLAGGAAPHPAQDARVTAALLAGRIEALFSAGRELKAHLRPSDLTDWFGVVGAAAGRVTTVVFPAVRRAAQPRKDDACGAAAVSDADFMTGVTEDSYPDIFGLTGGMGAGWPRARAEVAARLADVPGHAVVLGHDPRANAAFLTGLTRAAASAPAPAVAVEGA